VAPKVLTEIHTPSESSSAEKPGLPDFPWCNIPNWGKIYQISIKYNKWPQNITHGRKIDQMAIKYTNIFHYKALENLTILGFFCLKINHLATLFEARSQAGTTGKLLERSFDNFSTLGDCFYHDLFFLKFTQ
jgi:hypothetical protein